MRPLLVASLAAASLVVACSADPSPPGAPPMTFAYGCTRASQCPLEQPTMLGNAATLTMVVHGEPADAHYSLRTDLDRVFVNAHTSTCACAVDDLAASSGSCGEGKANVCTHRFIAQGLAEGDTPIEVLDGDAVIATTTFHVRRAASMDVKVSPEDAERAPDGAYLVKPGEKLSVTPVPRSADGAPLHYSGNGVTFGYPSENGVLVHDSAEPGPVEVVRAVTPGDAAVTVATGEVKHDVAVRVVAP
jgi:hypothetical protein